MASQARAKAQRFGARKFRGDRIQGTEKAGNCVGLVERRFHSLMRSSHGEKGRDRDVVLPDYTTAENVRGSFSRASAADI